MVIRKYLSGLTPSAPQGYCCNLTMIPLTSGDHTGEDYLLLDEAMELGTLFLLNGRVAAFIEACTSARVEAYDAPALGTDCRIFSEGVVGLALAFGDRRIHFSAFWRKGPGGMHEKQSPMARYTARRRHAGVERQREEDS